MMKQHDAILLASGGADSTTLAYWMIRKNISFLPLFFNYGQHCYQTELNSLKNNLPGELSNKLEVVDISQIYGHSKSLLIREPDLWKDTLSKDTLYVPYRNLLFLTAGAAFAQSMGIKSVYSAFINSNHAVEIDCSKNFFQNLENLLANIGAVSIQMPFRDMTKKEVLSLGLQLNAPVAQTYSCQVASSNPCGACPNCVERIEALNLIVDSEVGQQNA